MQQAGVAAEGECSRAACRARRWRARAPLSDLGAWLPLRAARCSRTRPEAAAEARAARAARIYAYQSHCTIHARKSCHCCPPRVTHICVQTERAIAADADCRARRRAGAAARRTTHAASVCAGQRSAAGGEAARRQGATVGRCQWRDGGGEVAVARWRWRRGEAASGCGSEAVRRRQDREAASCGSHSGSLSCRRPRQQPRCAAACASAASCCRAGSAAPLRQPLLCRSRPTSVGRERQRSVGRRGSSHALHLTHIVALHAMHSLPACEGLHDQRSSTPVDDAQDVVDDGAHEPTSIDGEVHEDVGAARRESWAATGPWHRSLFGVFGLCSACSALCSTEQPPLPKQRLARRFFRGGGE